MAGIEILSLGVVVIAFVATTIYTFVTVGTASANNDNKEEIAKVIYNTTIINSVFIVVLGLTAYFYFLDDDTVYDAYIMVMLHATLFIALLSSSVSVLHQLS